MNIRAASLREKAVSYAWHFINAAYRWRGDGPAFDCSGFVMEMLKAAGLEPSNIDKSANMLWLTYQQYVVSGPYPGCLAFWLNTKGEATHVEIVVDNEATIGASGGGSRTLTPEDAIQQKAFVRMRPLAHRGQYRLVDPFLSLG